MPKVVSPSRRGFIKRLITSSGILILPNLITNRVFGGVCVIRDVGGSKYLAVSKGVVHRPFDVGSWSKIRIGMHHAATDTGSAPNTAYVTFGVCASGNPYLSGSDKCIELFSYINARDATRGYYSSSASTSRVIYKRVPGSTQLVAGSNGHYIGKSGSYNFATVIEVAHDGSNNYTVMGSCTTSAAAATISTASFESGMIALDVSASMGLTDTAEGNTTQDFSATPLDSVDIGYQNTTAELQVAEIMVVKMA